jgi:hypothetical protein
MLGRLILIALQVVACWFGALQVLAYFPANIGADVRIILHGGLFGVIAWVVGLVGSQALRDVPLPSSATLLWALVGGLIGGALVVFKVPAMIPVAFAPMALPLALAIVGYAIKK